MTAVMVEVLRRYQQKGHLELSDRVVIGERVYDPSYYTLVHAGPEFGRRK